MLARSILDEESAGGSACKARWFDTRVLSNRNLYFPHPCVFADIINHLQVCTAIGQHACRLIHYPVPRRSKIYLTTGSDMLVLPLNIIYTPFPAFTCVITRASPMIISP